MMLEKVAVSEWMTSPVQSVAPAAPISEAHQRMKEFGIRRMPVVDHGKLVGIITIGDIREASPSDATTLSIWEVNYLWSKLTVERVMSRHVRTVKPTDSVHDAAQIMLEHKIGGLPVVDDAGHLVGIITESDIFKLLVTRQTETVTPR
jgi:CBS domain-containing protein